MVYPIKSDVHTEQDEDTLEKTKKEKHKNTDNKKNK